LRNYLRDKYTQLLIPPLPEKVKQVSSLIDSERAFMLERFVQDLINNSADIEVIRSDRVVLEFLSNG
jgi:hypothetical protein